MIYAYTLWETLYGNILPGCSMNAVSAISSGSGAYEIAPRKRRAAAEEPLGGNFGPDTVTISDEARQLLMGAKAATGNVPEEGDEAEQDTLDVEADASEKTSSSGTTLTRKSFFSILMESLFLAELEESGSGRPQAGGEGAAGTDAPETGAAESRRAEKSGSVLQDGPKAAELKKLITDFMNGKADLSDLPKAMAVGVSGNERAAAGVTRKAAGAAGQAGETGDDASASARV